ncbi:MAG: hypothetical protein H5U40_12705 [Polyangiaceae bacterium]|nr:hypothetical protein [Polyangiaceae bacterium]
MSPEEARDRFSDAFEDALSGEERAAFERALENDAQVAAEYEAFCDALHQTRAFGRVASPRPSIDLLEGVQARIRRRTRGRFYRDHFAAARGPNRLLVLIVAVLMLLLLGIAYAGLHYMDVLRAPVRPPRLGGFEAASPPADQE